MLTKMVRFGAAMLIPLGVAHGVHVARSADVEPYLWLASCFLIGHGLLTLRLLSRCDKSPDPSP